MRNKTGRFHVLFSLSVLALSVLFVGAPGATAGKDKNITFHVTYTDGHVDSGTAAKNEVDRTTNPGLHAKTLHVSCSDDLYNPSKSDLDGHTVKSYTIDKGGKTCGDPPPPSEPECPGHSHTADGWKYHDKGDESKAQKKDREAAEKAAKKNDPKYDAKAKKTTRGGDSCGGTTGTGTTGTTGETTGTTGEETTGSTSTSSSSSGSSSSTSTSGSSSSSSSTGSSGNGSTGKTDGGCKSHCTNTTGGSSSTTSSTTTTTTGTTTGSGSTTTGSTGTTQGGSGTTTGTTTRGGSDGTTGSTGRSSTSGTGTSTATATAGSGFSTGGNSTTTTTGGKSTGGESTASTTGSSTSTGPEICTWCEKPGPPPKDDCDQPGAVKNPHDGKCYMPTTGVGAVPAGLGAIGLLGLGGLMLRRRIA